MKRIFFFLAITGLLLASSGCSTNSRILGGGLNRGCNTCGNPSGGLFSGGLLRSSALQDGPVRQWLRGDACDSCNIPSGEITYDTGFDSTCQTCGSAASPMTSAPVTNYYPSYNEPTYGDESLPALPSIGPLEATSTTGGISESQFFGGANDSVELPPLSGF